MNEQTVITLPQHRRVRLARFIAASCFLCVCLWLSACSLRPVADAAVTPGPFALTGLMAYPGERPEEILVRAHGGDVRAIALVVAGYSFGMEGFPQEEFLAGAWLYEVYQAGAKHADAFLGTLIQRDIAPADDFFSPAKRTAMCDFGKESYFAPLFKDAGIFDIEARCLELASAREAGDTEWAVQYQDAMNGERRQGYHAAEMTLVRELLSRPATQEEVNWLERAAEGKSSLDNLPRYLFYAATTHDPEKDSPDWSDARLIDLMARQPMFSRKLRNRIKDTLILHASLDPSFPLDAIRRAHAGDADAMLLMARSYANGEMGFPRSWMLAIYWLKRSTLAGSPLGAALEATMSYNGSSGPDNVWMIAERAKQSGDPRSAAIAAALQRQMTLENAPQTMWEDYLRPERRRERYPRPGVVDVPVAGEHLIVVYENNLFKEIKKATDFPENMRFREAHVMRDGKIVTEMVPVARIEILLVGADGKQTTADKAVRMVITDYAEDGKELQRNTMLRSSKGE